MADFKVVYVQGGSPVAVTIYGADLLGSLVAQAQAAAADALATRNSFPNYFQGDKGPPGAGGNVAVGVAQLKTGPAAAAAPGDAWHLSDGAASGMFIATAGAPPATDNEGTRIIVSGTKYYARAVAPDRVFDAGWWGAVGNGIADDAVPIQRAVDRALEEGRATISLPGFHKLGSNIALPQTSLIGNAGRSITFKGRGQTPVGWGTNDGDVRLAPTSGLHIGALGSQGLFNSTNFAPDPNLINADKYRAIEVRMIDMDIQREDNPAGPGIDGRYLGGLFLDGVFVHTGRYTTRIIEPTNVGATGVIWPGLGNPASLWARGSTTVQGFYTGMRAGEHLATDGLLTISGCKVAMEFPALNDPVRIASLSEFNCQIGLRWTGKTNLHLTMWDQERKGAAQNTGAPAWQNRLYDIDDTINGTGVGEGYIGYHPLVQGAGAADYLLLRNGGNSGRLRYKNLRRDAPSTFTISKSANTAVPNGGAATQITFDQCGLDADMGVGTQVPTTGVSIEYTGYYDINAGVNFDNIADGIIQLLLTVNGAVADYDTRRAVGTGIRNVLRCSLKRALNRGDTVGLQVYGVGATSTAVEPYLEVTKL